LPALAAVADRGLSASGASVGKRRSHFGRGQRPRLQTARCCISETPRWKQI